MKIKEIIDGVVVERDMTEEEIAEMEFQRKRFENSELILQLKQKLLNTDYICLKYAEGELTEEEYAPIKEQRRQWRVEINRLEEELKNGESR